MKIATILLCIATILSFVLGTVCYVTNVGDCRVHVSSWDGSVQNWSVIDNMFDPFSFEAGLFWDLGLILLVISGVLIYICVKSRSTAPKKEMSLNKIIFILITVMVVSIAIVMIGVVNDMMWLGCIGLLSACVAGIFMVRAWRTKRYRKMSDERLIELFQKYATDIQTTLSVCGGLTGLGSTIATNKANSDIRSYREKGELIGAVLEERGYTVNYSVLSGEVSKGKSKSDIGAIIKGAVVGGIIAGDVGAVIGAAHAMNKNNKK